jgi:hypothetical protein
MAMLVLGICDLRFWIYWQFVRAIIREERNDGEKKNHEI